MYFKIAFEWVIDKNIKDETTLISLSCAKTFAVFVIYKPLLGKFPIAENELILDLIMIRS